MWLIVLGCRAVREFPLDEQSAGHAMLFLQGRVNRAYFWRSARSVLRAARGRFALVLHAKFDDLHELQGDSLSQRI